MWAKENLRHSVLSQYLYQRIIPKCRADRIFMMNFYFECFFFFQYNDNVNPSDKLVTPQTNGE